MRLSDVLLPFLAILIIINWTIGIESEKIDDLQFAIELMLMCIVLIETIPRFIKKLKPGDAKKFLGVLPTIALLMVLAWKFPNIDPTLLEILATVLFVVNLLTLTIVKRKLAKYLAKKTDDSAKVS